MKKLKKMKLHSAVVLQEKEMKAVQGGLGWTCNPNATTAITCFSSLACIRGPGLFGHCQWNAGRGVCTCEGFEDIYDDYGYGSGYECKYGPSYP